MAEGAATAPTDAALTAEEKAEAQSRLEIQGVIEKKSYVGLVSRDEEEDHQLTVSADPRLVHIHQTCLERGARALLLGPLSAHCFSAKVGLPLEASIHLAERAD